jgi:hypothetical protein
LHPFLRNRRLDQDQARGLVVMAGGEHPHHQPSERVSDEDVRRRYAAVLEEVMQFVGDAPGGARQWSACAPAESGAVVHARARERRHVRMHEAPAQ